MFFFFAFLPYHPWDVQWTAGLLKAVCRAFSGAESTSDGSKASRISEIAQTKLWQKYVCCREHCSKAGWKGHWEADWDLVSEPIFSNYHLLHQVRTLGKPPKCFWCLLYLSVLAQPWGFDQSSPCSAGNGMLKNVCSAPFARHLWAEWICDLFLDSWGVLIIFHVFLRRVSNISPRKFKTRAQQFKTIYRDVVLCAMVWFRLSGLPPVADGAGGAVSWSHGLSDVFWYSAKC